MVREEMSKIDFQDGICGGHLGFSISSFSYFVSHKRPNAHHQVLIQLDYRGDVQNMNSQHFCMGKQIWPCRKKVKRLWRKTILAILVDLLSPRICAKIRPQGLFGSGEKIFKGFYHIWAWWPSWSMDCDYFSNLSFPQPKEVPHEIWATLA